jgi:glutaredoxin-like protein NrdH
MQITVWTLPNCVQCQQTKKQFDSMGIRYEEKSLDSDPFKADFFRAKGLLTAPIVETDVKLWAGFRLDKIRSLAAHLKSLGETAAPAETAPGEQTREFYRKQGEQREQERIIKLIEPLGCPANGIEHDCENNLTLYTATDLITLIKGEK